MELGGDASISYSHQENDNSSILSRSFSLDNTIGYCLTDNLELEFRPFITYKKTIDRDKVSPTSPTDYKWEKGAGGGPALTYNFPSDSNVIPFVTLGYGAIDFRYEVRSGSVSAAIPDTVPVTLGIIGLKIFSGDSGCVRVGATYTRMWVGKDTIDVMGPELPKWELALTLGYSIFF